MGTLREELVKRGATTSQLNAAAVEMAEQAIAEGAVDEMKTADNLAKRLIGTIESESRKLRDWQYDSEQAKKSASMLNSAVTNANEAIVKLNRGINAARSVSDQMALSDNTLRQSVFMYDEILHRTKDVVGKDITEAIWLKTIEAASYGMWRAIMGPKFEEKAPRRI